MFKNVDGRTDDGRTTDGRTPDAGVTGILIAHLRAFGSGELIRTQGNDPSEAPYHVCSNDDPRLKLTENHPHECILLAVNP